MSGRRFRWFVHSSGDGHKERLGSERQAGSKFLLAVRIQSLIE
jgi:hypothetical protein